MDDLIKRLEEAAEGSRDLDCAIYESLGFPKADYMGRKVKDYTLAMQGYYGVITEDGYLHLSARKAPTYTTSLDAALTLVPGSREWSAGVDLENGKGWATVGDDIWDECFNDITGIAKTPALALCIAALRARQS